MCGTCGRLSTSIQGMSATTQTRPFSFTVQGRLPITYKAGKLVSKEHAQSGCHLQRTRLSVSSLATVDTDNKLTACLIKSWHVKIGWRNCYKCRWVRTPSRCHNSEVWEQWHAGHGQARDNSVTFWLHAIRRRQRGPHSASARER